jgi:hypothetical protein
VLSYSKKSPENTNRSVVSREMSIKGSSPLRSIREGGSDDESLNSYVPSDNESVSADAHPIPAVHGELPSEDDCINPDTIDLSAIAQSMFDSKSDANYSEEETAVIMNSTVNTKQYEKNRSGIEARFFDTVEKFGGDSLKPLTLFARDGFRKNRLFYIKL